MMVHKSICKYTSIPIEDNRVILGRAEKVIFMEVGYDASQCMINISNSSHGA